LEKQSTSCQKSNSNPEISEELTDLIQFMIHEWLTTGEDHLPHTKFPYGFAVWAKIRRMKSTPVLSLPDVTHHAAAVALVVQTEQ
jgi:hypothetical protein